MRGAGLFAVLVAGALVAGCQGGGDQGAAPAPASSGSPATSPGATSSTQVASADGAALYTQHCQGCHGDKGQGASGPEIAHEVNEERGELVQVILNGKGKMPSFKGKLTEAQAGSVVEHLRTFAGDGDARPVH